jgi:hypothetical protein
MATTFKNVKNRASTTLNDSGGINASETSVIVTAASVFPSVEFWATIEDEIVLVTNISSNTLTITRAQQSTSGAIHADGVKIQLHVTAQDITDIQNAINDRLETAGGTMTGDTFIANGSGMIIGHTAQVAVSNTPEFQLLGTGGADAAMLLARFRNNSSGPTIRFLKGRNDTIGSLAIVQDNDDIGTFKFFADDGVDFATEAAQFGVEVDDASPAAGDIGTAFVWQQMAGGAAALAETMRLSAAGLLTVATITTTGAITGNVTGNVSGSSGSTTGNAATATALETARTIGGVSFDGTGNIAVTLSATTTALATARDINGVSFDGTGNITVTAAAGTLTGTTLNSSVVTTSATTVAALNAGSITSGFGNIDVGASSIAAGSFDASDGNITNVGDIALDSITADGTEITLASNTFIANSSAMVIGHDSSIATSNTATFQLLGTGGSDSTALLARFSGNDKGPTMRFLKSRSTIGSHAIIQDDDIIGRFKWYGDDGEDFATEIASLDVEVDDANPAVGDIGAAFVFLQMQGAGAAQAETMRLDALGNLTLSIGSSIFLTEKADADADVAGKGQIWVDTATANVLYFTDDAGTDFAISRAEKALQMVIVDFGASTSTGDGKFYFHIDSRLAGFNLVDVHAEVITAGTTNTTDIQLRNVTQSADILSTKLTIDTGETGSDTAATAAVINASEDDMTENDVIAVDIDAVSSTAARGLIITLGFKLP